MKRLYGICILMLVFLCSCGVNSLQKPQERVRKETKVTLRPTEIPEETEVPEPTAEPYEVIEKRNIKIKGRCYKYAAYAKTVSGKITLKSLKTEEDELYIPSEIEGNPVVMLGWPEETSGYQWPDENKLGWNLGKNKRCLKRVIIGEGIEKIEDLGGVVADEVIIPKSMKDIGTGAFSGGKIKKVLVRSSQVNFGFNAFSNSTLEQIHFPDDFSGRIDSLCFNGSNLKEFRWPAYGKQKLGDMGNSIFEGCKKLKKITFPENQERIIIPKHSFFWCKKLKKLEFPASTKKVVYEATHYADNYKYGVSTLIFKGKNTKLKGGDIRDVNLLTEVPVGLSLITVKKIIAPKDSKAIEFAKKAVKIADMNEWKPEDATCENGLDHPAVLQEDLVPVEYEIRG